jgi:DUF4097 and DUF4098 domain-containing protein YvlB
MDSENHEPENDLVEKPKREQPEEEVVYGVPVDEETPPRRRSSRWPLYIVIGCLMSCFACCVLPVCGVASVVAGVAFVYENNKVTDTQTKVYPLETDDPITLEIDNSIGDVVIEHGNDDEVVVEYTKQASGITKSQARDELDNIEVLIDWPSADHITITVDISRQESWVGKANEANLTVKVPESLYLDITTDRGKIAIESVTARSLRAKNSTGDIEFDGVLGTNPTNDFSLETDLGSITLFLPKETYLAVSAKADVGNVTVSDNFDRVNRDNSSGSGEVVSDRWAGTLGDGNEDPPTLKLQVNVGDITINAP